MSKNKRSAGKTRKPPLRDALKGTNRAVLSFLKDSSTEIYRWLMWYDGQVWMTREHVLPGNVPPSTVDKGSWFVVDDDTVNNSKRRNNRPDYQYCMVLERERYWRLVSSKTSILGTDLWKERQPIYVDVQSTRVPALREYDSIWASHY